MPQMKRMRLMQDGSDAHTGSSQPLAQVVILAAPADKRFIKAVDAFEIRAGDSHIS